MAKPPEGGCVSEAAFVDRAAFRRLYKQAGPPFTGGCPTRSSHPAFCRHPSFAAPPRPRECGRTPGLYSWSPLAICLLLLAIAAVRPSAATEAFAYVWREGPVTVRWSEGNGGARDAAVRGLVGHWKRLAVSAWTPSRVPLRVDVSLYGPAMGSGPPHVRLTAGGRAEEAMPATADVAALPAADVGFLAALARLKGGGEGEIDGGHLDPAMPASRLTDDGWPRFAPDGRWRAFRTWRSGTPEVWMTPADARQVYRFVMPRTQAPPGTGAARLPVVGELIDAGPDWSPDGRSLLWVQGGRLCLVDTETLTGRILTPADADVRTYAWSPNSRHAVVDFEDGRLAILDRVREIVVPFHSLLPRLVAAGDYEWSPSGRRLLFRGQGGVSSANFARPTPFRRFIDRAVAAATGRAERPEPPLVVGDYRERLALYDLAAQRVTTVPLEASPDSISEVRGAAWSTAEERLYLAARSADGRFVLWGLTVDPLRLSVSTPAPDPTTHTHGTLEILGWRGTPRGPAGEPPSHARRLALLAGDQLFLLGPDGNDRIEAAGRLQRASLVPGPDGGFRGVETEESTEDERGLWLTLEDHDRGAMAPAKIRFADGIYASLVPGSRMGTALLALIGEGGVVDLDMHPADDAAIVLISRGGGVGELITVDADGTLRSVSRALNGANVATIALRDAPFAPMGTRSGTAELASSFQPSGALPMGILVGLLLLALALGVWLRRRARRDSPTRR